MDWLYWRPRHGQEQKRKIIGKNKGFYYLQHGMFGARWHSGKELHKNCSHYGNQKKLKGSKQTNNYLQIYSAVGRKERARAGIMIMIDKSFNLPLIIINCGTKE
jgi:hypothetical protein